MTRIFTDGAEMVDTLFWDGSSGLFVVSAIPVPYASAYCYKLFGSYTYAYRFVPASNECYLRQRIYFGDESSGVPDFRSGTTTLGGFGIDATAHPFVYAGGVVLETASEVVVLNQWYLFEIHYKIDDVNGRFEVKMDGVQVIDYTGDTKYGSYSTFDNIKYTPSSILGVSATIALDDLAMNDVNGGSDNSWCGDGIIVKTTPNANGTHNQWHGSDGDNNDNYLLVDEYPHDSDTTYVYHDGSGSGQQDQYNLTDDYDGTNKTILRIYPEARIRKTAAASHTVKLGTLAFGGADYMSAALTLTTNYARYVGIEQTVNPVDSLPWEEPDIDNLEIIVEVG